MRLCIRDFLIFGFLSAWFGKVDGWVPRWMDGLDGAIRCIFEGVSFAVKEAGS